MGQCVGVVRPAVIVSEPSPRARPGWVERIAHVAVKDTEVNAGLILLAFVLALPEHPIAFR